MLLLVWIRPCSRIRLSPLPIDLLRNESLLRMRIRQGAPRISSLCRALVVTLCAHQRSTDLAAVIHGRFYLWLPILQQNRIQVSQNAAALANFANSMSMTGSQVDASLQWLTLKTQAEILPTITTMSFNSISNSKLRTANPCLPFHLRREGCGWLARLPLRGWQTQGYLTTTTHILCFRPTHTGLSFTPHPPTNRPSFHVPRGSGPYQSF